MSSEGCSANVSETQASEDKVACFAEGSHSHTEDLSDISFFIEKLSPVIDELKKNNLTGTPPIQKCIESLETEINRAKALIESPKGRSSPAKHLEDLTQNLGRSLGLVLFASRDVSMDGKEKIEALRREMMGLRCSVSSERESGELVSYTETEEGTEEEIVEVLEEDGITLDCDDVVLQLKYGNDEEFRCALSGLMTLIGDNMVTNERINDEGIIDVLFNRLGSRKSKNRLTIIQILRSLVAQNDENKEKMADAVYLSTLVKSLARDVEEQKEAAGLLLTLSDVAAVRRRIGRIQGCIVMLVSIFNGDDPAASSDAGRLLNALSSNTQNALHMAEAGYFKPLVHYLKEVLNCIVFAGSDMSMILMATALSRMGLTDQSRASLAVDGAIEPLVKLFITGKLEAKLSALSALQNLSGLKENIQRLIDSGIVAFLLQLLFSVTSVMMTLREPASAILAKIAESESILVNQDVAQQMLSLLNLSSPVIQHHLLQALNSIASHPSALRVRGKMKEDGAMQLLLPFLNETNIKIRTAALNLICTLTKDLQGELEEQLGETHLRIIVDIVSSSTLENEKVAAIGILSNLPLSDRKATDILKRANLVPVLVSIMNLSHCTVSLTEGISGILIRFTVATDKKLQFYSAEHGVIPLLVKLLSNGSTVAKCKAATSLSQLSQNTLSLRKSRTSGWFCVPPTDSFCEVHDGVCSVKSNFCLVKAGAITPLIKILESNEREPDEAVLTALGTLLQDGIWEKGSDYIVKKSGVQAMIKVLELGSVKAQEKALWILERILRIEAHRVSYGESAQVVLIDLAQKGDPKLKPATAKLLAQLELLQCQSSYF